MPKVDMALFAKFMLPAAIVVLILIYIFLRKIVISYIELRRKVRVQEHAMRMRQGGQKTEQAIVRKTDIFEQLTAQQKAVHKQAEALAAQKNFREAARLFESINFQRKAIDLLEFNGFVDEAAQTLLRMKVPFRAAVVYERNHQFVKAAECFIMDQKHDSAARAYDKAAVQDFHLFLKAAESYKTAGMVDQCLDAYAKVLKTAEIVKIAFGSQKFETLATYMADPYVARDVLTMVSLDQAKDLVTRLNLRPSWVQSMTLWVLYQPDLGFLQIILNRLVDEEHLAQLFWSRLTSAYLKYLHQELTKQPEALTSRIYTYHAGILRGNGQTETADIFFQSASRLPAPTL